MANTVIKVENLSKQYRLGEISTGTLTHDLNKWWYKIQGKQNPYIKIGEENDRTIKGDSDYVWALQDINFEVKQGEVLGVIGRNGAGKSTLLKLLSRTTSPTQGLIKIKGRVASLLEVGTGFHPELSGRDNIFLNGAILGMTQGEIKKKFDEIVDFAGVQRYIDTPVKRYSSGMYVRLAFAVAAHLEPEILIVDEVLAVGDIEFQKKCLGKMNDVSQKEGRTVIFVSHNMGAISVLTRDCIVLENGHLKFSGATEKAIYQYQKLENSENIYYNSKTPNSDEPYIRKVQVITSELDYLHQHGKELRILFEVFTPIAIPKAALSFQIFNEMQTPCIHSWFFGTEHQFLEQAGVHTIECIIPKARLYQGNYSLRVFLGKFGGDLFETLSDICEFEVAMLNQNRDFPWMKGSCVYIEDCKWQKKGNEIG
jgi:lipopolysaccharide transport system ATP-binding protein